MKTPEEWDALRKEGMVHFEAIHDALVWAKRTEVTVDLCRDLSELEDNLLRARLAMSNLMDRIGNKIRSM